jgi:hypothetical protein
VLAFHLFLALLRFVFFPFVLAAPTAAATRFCFPFLSSFFLLVGWKAKGLHLRSTRLSLILDHKHI